MNIELVFKTLSILETCYPEKTTCLELASLIKPNIKNQDLLRKYLNDELKQVINYLDESKKIELGNHFQGINISRGVLLGNETITINHKGIDYLAELNLVIQKEKEGKRQDSINESIKYATLVLAFIAIFEFAFEFFFNAEKLVEGKSIIFRILIVIIYIGIIIFTATFIHKSIKNAKNPS